MKHNKFQVRQVAWNMVDWNCDYCLKHRIAKSQHSLMWNWWWRHWSGINVKWITDPSGFPSTFFFPKGHWRQSSTTMVYISVCLSNCLSCKSVSLSVWFIKSSVHYKPPRFVIVIGIVVHLSVIRNSHSHFTIKKKVMLMAWCLVKYEIPSGVAWFKRILIFWSNSSPHVRFFYVWPPWAGIGKFSLPKNVRVSIWQKNENSRMRPLLLVKSCKRIIPLHWNFYA